MTATSATASGYHHLRIHHLIFTWQKKLMGVTEAKWLVRRTIGWPRPYKIQILSQSMCVNPQLQTHPRKAQELKGGGVTGDPLPVKQISSDMWSLFPLNIAVETWTLIKLSQTSTTHLLTSLQNHFHFCSLTTDFGPRLANRRRGRTDPQLLSGSFPLLSCELCNVPVSFKSLGLTESFLLASPCSLWSYTVKFKYTVSFLGTNLLLVASMSHPEQPTVCQRRPWQLNI